MKPAAGLIVVASLASLASGCAGPTASSSASSTSSPSASATALAIPPPRAYAAMAYDPQIRKLVMYGGSSELGQLSDTWAWDGKGWSLLSTATDPVTQNPSMAYDATGRQLYLFGTAPTTQPSPQLNVVSVWKQGGWQQVYSWTTPACGKSCPTSLGKPFGAGSVTYVSALGKIIMLAGGPGGPGAETWSWDGASWSQVPTVHRPLTVGCCPVYVDATRQLVALGYAGNGWGGINRTWIFDGSDWQLSPVFTQNGMEIATVADPGGVGVLLLVGNRPGASPLETWRWDGHAWQRLETSAPPDYPGFSLGSDPEHKQVILFGGRDAFGRAVSDTWVWDGRSWQKRSAS